MPVQLVVDGDVAEVVLDRPDKLNALEETMLAELDSRLGEVSTSGARALVVRGEGRGFSAGRDLATMDLDNEDPEVWLTTHVTPRLLRLRSLPIPTFAAVHGACLGIGLGVAFACDVVIAAESTRIGSPFAQIGAVLDSGGHYHLVNRVGPHVALDLIYSGRLVDGNEAARLGLVSRVVADAEVVQTTRDAARAAAAGPTRALQLSKAIVHRITEEGLGLEAVLAAEASAQGAASRTADYREGMAAFAAKRAPRFTGT